MSIEKRIIYNHKMKKFFIPHKVKIADITHLADNDSTFAISGGIKEEEYIEINSPSGLFLAQVTFVQPKSVEIEVINMMEEKINLDLKITIFQSISNISKFGNFLEKITQLGVYKIVPIISEFTIPDLKTISKDIKIWDKIIREASQQSRNYLPPEITKPINLKNIESLILSGKNICFATENVKTNPFTKEMVKDQELNLAFGPESGWSRNDTAIFKKNNFQFVTLKGNILRTETTPIVVTSIIKFIHQEL